MPRKLVAEFELDVSLSQFFSYFWDDESPFYDAFMKEALEDVNCFLSKGPILQIWRRIQGTGCTKRLPSPGRNG